MHTRQVVGWSIRQTLHTEIALEALSMAVERQRLAPGLIHHSDRGIQYAAEAYRQALAAAGITPSMSRKGDCWDNAPMESFFHTLKTERVHHRVYTTRDEARRDLFGYIEGFCYPRRMHSAKGYIGRAEAKRRAAQPVHFFGGRSLSSHQEAPLPPLKAVADCTHLDAPHTMKLTCYSNITYEALERN